MNYRFQFYELKMQFKSRALTMYLAQFWKMLTIVAQGGSVKSDSIDTSGENKTIFFK